VVVAHELAKHLPQLNENSIDYVNDQIIKNLTFSQTPPKTSACFISPYSQTPPQNTTCLAYLPHTLGHQEVLPPNYFVQTHRKHHNLPRTLFRLSITLRALVVALVIPSVCFFFPFFFAVPPLLQVVGEGDGRCTATEHACWCASISLVSLMAGFLTFFSGG
jgi:hypothetical protein